MAYTKYRSAWADASGHQVNAAFTNQLEQAVFDLKNIAPNAKDFGAVGDGVTNDSTAIVAAEAAAVGGFVNLPPGTYKTTTLDGSQLTGRFQGVGKILDSGGHKRGPWFSLISAPPTSFGSAGVITAFDGDLSRVQIAMEHRITGATTLRQPATGYQTNPEASAVMVYLYNDSGWNQSTSAASGRTAAAAYHTSVYNAGQGDIACFSASAYVTGVKAGATSWTANAAGILYNGGVQAGAAGVNLNPFELELVDNGFDVAAGGATIRLIRTNDTGALETLWSGVRVMSTGTKAIDTAFMAQNAGTGTSGFLVGLDISPANLPTTGTWVNAAITLKGNQRIYFNASGTDAAAGVYRRPSSTGTSYIEYNTTAGGVRINADGVAALEAHSTFVLSNVTLGLATGSVFQISGLTVVGARQTGWAAPTGTLSRATFDQSTVTLPQLAQRVAALITDLTTHGLIGT